MIGWQALVDAAPRVFPDDAAFPRHLIEAALVDDFEPFIPPPAAAFNDGGAPRQPPARPPASPSGNAPR